MKRRQLTVDNPSVTVCTVPPSITQGRLDADVLDALDRELMKAAADAFRESLRPFGLDEFMLSDEPARILALNSGRVLAEFRTMLLPVWYPEKLKELEKAGFDVVTIRRTHNSHPPMMMYYVRSVREIWRKM